ncbi:MULTISPECIES: error-prone DNA polymerase [Burkholderia]|jgi:error-prone DNA polymerase|uniref:Error-prone DNA polymerase n=3 Tax=Burkholderia TaxID=32008 RepID=A0A1E3FEQ8_9BURK|nr:MULTISPECIES: error-prone DNA polymerase [Burkholderia]UTP22714.1 error-prone DNA polymerase [Burkholderia sp. FXe9]KKL43030.1 DNA polymerase [Burkholderia contaminans LMG 23361]MBA9830871.1 error-prone DNA polymerase [Burkholderia contaminans]MBA9841014.1 error-prone DNA polymerase [Burkholderia contaminans]MBA9864130.1 error-prone DNA polymerase [Burkholderia contaminans]
MMADFSGLPDYAELFCRSNFSFLHGASHAEELVERAVELGYRGIAITDECSLAGAPRMHIAAKAKGLPLVIGSYFDITPDEVAPGQDPGPGAFGLVLLAQNREGYGNLSELISWRRMASPKGTYTLTSRMLSRPPEAFAHLRGMPDCFAILVPAYPVRADVLDAQVAWFRATFGERARLGLVQLQRALDGPQREEIREAGERRRVRIVALGDVTMHVRSCKPLQDVMTAIRVGMPVSECGYALAPNAEQHLRTRGRIAKLFSADEIEETCAMLDACDFELDSLRYEYPDEIVPEEHTPTSYLEQETMAGAADRYPQGVPEKVEKQIRHELDLIAKLKYEPFFLTVYDIVKYARSQNILCQGRGSAANSVVCYCLGITEVDPDQSTMLFERFISAERGEPPDIDVDFEHQRREEVIQHIYKKYGKDRAALAAAVSTYRPRGVLRETGKALGVDPMLVDRVAKGHRWFDGSRDLLQQFSSTGLDPQTPLIRTWAELAARLLNFPRHLSQHSGGFVISRGKLTRLVPVENAAMDGRRVIQWDKDDLEALGLMKVDVLALGMLSALHRAFDMRTAWRGPPEPGGEPFTLKHIPQDDKATYDMICRADTVGVFQIESRAQMSMLPRLRPKTYYDLVIEVAIVRPGPIQGGAVHPYLKRRQGLEKVSYPKEDLKPALERTYGVPIFQEQVMQIAMIAAGFTPGEADELRRAMAAWKRKGNLEKYHSKIVDGMRERDYPPDFAEQIFEQIKGFGDYGFPESHAASFAKLAYASSWLKCHEPAIFLAALLNSQPMGFYPPSQLVQDAKRHGVRVLPIDVTQSNWEASLEALPDQPPPHGQPAVRLGLSLVRGLGEAAARRIEAARTAAGPFDNVDTLARRAQLERRDLEALAAANALATLAGHRRDALWQAVAAAPERDLLATAPIDEPEQPALGAPSEADDILADYHTTGLTLNRHPVALLRPELRARRLSSAAELHDRPDGRLARACGLVTARQMPGTAKGVMFMTLEDETGCVNLIVRPELLARQRRETLDSRLLAASGVWQVASDVRHLVVQHFEDLTPLLGGLRTSSREFH